MKSLMAFTFSFFVFLGFNSFAITRVIDCDLNSNVDQKMSIVLKGGNAVIYTCTGSPCSSQSNLDPIEFGILNMPDPQAETLHYEINSGNSPATGTVDITFGSTVVVSIDGDSTLYNCQ